MKIRIVVYGTPSLGQRITDCFAATPDIEIIGITNDLDHISTLVSASKHSVVLLEAGPNLYDPATIMQRICLQSQYANCRFLILAHNLDIREIQYAVSAGALGYVLINPQLENLAHSVRLVSTGKMAFAPEIARLLL
jgi:DNA-binding NarL/FixJ family response regulator